MNNNTVIQKLPADTEDTLGVIAPLLSRVLSALHTDMLPAGEDVLQLRSALQAYVAAIDLKASQAARYGELVFENCKDSYIPDADLIENPAAIPNMSQVMLRFAVKKLVSPQDETVSEEMVRQLVRAGYIAPVARHTQQDTETGYTLTSKGRLWFDRKKLSLKLKKDESFRALPAALQIDPDTWTAETAYQAFTLMRYYERIAHSDYLLFPLSGDRNILLGCEVSSSSELHYCLTWIDSFTQNKALRAYLLELISVAADVRVTIICTTETQKAAAARFVHEISAEEHIELVYLEEDAK